MARNNFPIYDLGPSAPDPDQGYNPGPLTRYSLTNGCRVVNPARVQGRSPWCSKNRELIISQILRTWPGITSRFTIWGRPPQTPTRVTTLDPSHGIPLPTGAGW